MSRLVTSAEPRRGHTTRRIMAKSLALTVCVMAGSNGVAQERVEHAAAGISLTRPAGWHTATLAQVQASREQTKLSDPELQAALATRSALPVIVFTKYQEPHPGINPSVQVTLRQALPGTPVRLLTDALRTMRQAFADLKIIEPVRAANVAGLAGAHVRLTYTLQNQTGTRARVISRLWLVPRGSLMFLIGMSGSESGRDVCEGEFDAVLKSMAIQP
jgi:hypothetical protein